MSLFTWGALVATFRQMAVHLKSNSPPPPPAESADLADALDHIATNLPAVITALRAHQGVLTATDDLLRLLAGAGVSWASTADAAVLAAPGALTDAQKWLPTILWALTAFQPAAPGVQGDNHIHVGRG